MGLDTGRRVSFKNWGAWNPAPVHLFLQRIPNQLNLVPISCFVPSPNHLHVQKWDSTLFLMLDLGELKNIEKLWPFWLDSGVSPLHSENCIYVSEQSQYMEIGWGMGKSLSRSCELSRAASGQVNRSIWRSSNKGKSVLRWSGGKSMFDNCIISEGFGHPNPNACTHTDSSAITNLDLGILSEEGLVRGAVRNSQSHQMWFFEELGR